MCFYSNFFRPFSKILENHFDLKKSYFSTFCVNSTFISKDKWKTKRGTFFENLVVSICYIPPSHQAILTKFAPEVALGSTWKDPKSDLRKVTPKGVKWGVKRGQNGVMGVKSYLSSDLHQIWWEGAFLKVIKGSSIRFSRFWLLVPHLTPRRGQGGQMGVKRGSNGG